MCRIAPNQSINRSWFARLPLLWMQYTLFLYARFQLFVALGAGLVGLFCPHFQHPTFFTFFIPFWLLALVFSCLSCFGWLFLSFSTLVLECFFHFFLSFLTAVFVRRESMLKSWLEPLMKQQRLLSMVDTYSLTRMRLLSLQIFCNRVVWFTWSITLEFSSMLQVLNFRVKLYCTQLPTIFNFQGSKFLWLFSTLRTRESNCIWLSNATLTI